MCPFPFAFRSPQPISSARIRMILGFGSEGLSLQEIKAAVIPVKNNGI